LTIHTSKKTKNSVDFQNYLLLQPIYEKGYIIWANNSWSKFFGIWAG
jgi:hypothetical protein